MKYSILPFDETAHKAGLMRLWRENLSLTNEHRFEWLYKKNPAGPPITFIGINNATAEICGCASIYPREIQFMGKTQKIGILVDFAVDQNHRVFGPAIALQKKIIDFLKGSEYIFVFGYPNKIGEGIFRRLGYIHLGDADRWSKLLNTKSKINSNLNNILLLKVLSIVLDKGLNFFNKIRLFKFKKEFYWTEISHINSEFETLYFKSRKKFPIYGYRTKSYLSWRYSQPDKENKFWGAYSNTDKRLVGFIVYRLEKGVVNLQDIVFENDNLSCVLFLSLAVEMYKQKSVAINLSYFGNSGFLKNLKKAFFIKRPFQRRCYIYPNPTKITDKELANLKLKDNWHLFDGELDL